MGNLNIYACSKREKKQAVYKIYALRGSVWASHIYRLSIEGSRSDPTCGFALGKSIRAKLQVQKMIKRCIGKGGRACPVYLGEPTLKHGL